MKSILSLCTKTKKLSQQKDWPSFIYIGDCGVDLVNNHPTAGGCALNVSYYLHQLNQKVDVLTWLGNDSKTNVPLNILHKIKADPVGIHHLPGQTPTQHIEVQTNGEKRFIKYEEGVLAKPKLTVLDIAFVKQHQILITLYYSQITHLFEQASKINFDGIKVIDFMNTADFNSDPDFIKKYLNWLDIGVFGLDKHQDKFIETLKIMAKKYHKLFIITLGEEGSKVFWGDKEFYQPTQATKVADTTGCGDAFLAGFLSEFIKSQNIDQAMQLGSKMAAKTSQFVGAMPENKSNN